MLSLNYIKSHYNGNNIEEIRKFFLNLGVKTYVIKDDNGDNKSIFLNRFNNTIYNEFHLECNGMLIDLENMKHLVIPPSSLSKSNNRYSYGCST